MKLAPRRNHLFTLEAFYHVAVVVGLLVAGLALYRTFDSPLGTAPLTDAPKQVVPATGEQGYPVEAFCNDPATTVKRSIAPPDSTFRATYDLDRRVNGIHEVVTVSIYPDGRAVGTYYDSNNVPRDANPTEDAIKCIEKKAK